MTTYKEMPQAIASLRPFRGSSVRAIVTDDYRYQVFSYEELILDYNLVKNKVGSFDYMFYSTTTSKIQNIIRKTFPELRENCIERRLYLYSMIYL